MENIAMNLSDWCRIDAAATYIGVSTSFLRKMVREKRIPHARAGSKVLLFRRTTLDSWLEANGSRGELTDPKNEGR
jgi:excisionase family DNA binding protein